MMVGWFDLFLGSFTDLVAFSSVGPKACLEYELGVSRVCKGFTFNVFLWSVERGWFSGRLSHQPKMTPALLSSKIFSLAH